MHSGPFFVGAARNSRERLNEWDHDAMCEPLALGQIIRELKSRGNLHFRRIQEKFVRSCKKSMFEILRSRQLKLPVLTTTMCFGEPTLNARPLTSENDDTEDLETLTCNHFLLGRPVVAEPLMPDSVRYIDCRKMYKVAQSYNQMIWNR